MYEERNVIESNCSFIFLIRAYSRSCTHATNANPDITWRSNHSRIDFLNKFSEQARERDVKN